MKSIFILFLFSLFFFSCNKEETPEPEIPQWLNTKIEEFENTEQHCWSCEITRYTYNNEFYYNLYCSYWSCMFCQFYNQNGQLVSEIETFDFEDFNSSSKDEKVIWNCQNLN
jgi:hypothetical protein